MYYKTRIGVLTLYWGSHQRTQQRFSVFQAGGPGAIDVAELLLPEREHSDRSVLMVGRTLRKEAVFRVLYSVLCKVVHRVSVIQ